MHNRRTLLFALSAGMLAWPLPTQTFFFAAISAVLLIPSAMAQTVQKIPRLAILQLTQQVGEASFLQGTKRSRLRGRKKHYD